MGWDMKLGMIGVEFRRRVGVCFKGIRGEVVLVVGSCFKGIGWLVMMGGMSGWRSCRSEGVE